MEAQRQVCSDSSSHGMATEVGAVRFEELLDPLVYKVGAVAVGLLLQANIAGPVCKMLNESCMTIRQVSFC